jgi:hypothetical protein
VAAGSARAHRGLGEGPLLRLRALRLAFDPEIYRQRHAVDYGINRLKSNHAVATRYDKLLPASTPGREAPMGADYYSADTENGDHLDDPSEDGLFMLVSDLNLAGNTFITSTPAANDPAWHASVTLLDDGTYEVERGDPSRREQHRDSATSPNDIARDLTIWLAARDYPGRPARRSDADF